jgi:hypothetical protein
MGIELADTAGGQRPTKTRIERVGKGRVAGVYRRQPANGRHVGITSADVVRVVRWRQIESPARRLVFGEHSRERCGQRLVFVSGNRRKARQSPGIVPAAPGAIKRRNRLETLGSRPAKPQPPS